MEHVDCRYHFTDLPAIDAADDERRFYCCLYGAASPCTRPEQCDKRTPVGPLQSPAGQCGDKL